ncbi:MAG: riboflavin biosynthesis protein RibD [Leeuwenhoekiella sp.]|nr:riboflavin biosynthesis protein RibD [Leeuwenhoekiella sp.]MBA82050.1 riboflavin biosynthesis protein RibD [Leeuwenhoekiella sp.]|tara:strand:+ start:12004 stop:13029 length:1026 start_codon:yes stop_codon:yes gene_type:complete
MARCLQLAKNGLGTTYPNPMVGAVVIHNNRIIGEGWHHKAGQPHAEVNAINSVNTKELLKEATIYVSLEPCSHFGKTPPCSDLIIASGIKKVIIGSFDPFAAVAGRGIKKLLDAGCEVMVGVLEQDCKELNKRFFTFHTQQRPYIILKWAESNDGFIAPDTKTRENREPVWITTPASRQLVHKWRAEEMGILIGTNTAKADNPSLTTRDWAGNSPVRIVLDRELKLPKSSTIFDGSHPTLIIAEKSGEDAANLKYIKADFEKDLPVQITDILYSEGLQSVIIEGGAKTLNSFIESGLWDEARIFKGSTHFGNGVAAPNLEASGKTSTSNFSGDLLTIHYRL